MSVKQAWDKTRGYKTASAGMLILIFQLLKLIWPDLVGERWEEWILNAIGIVGGTGALDKAWRSRDKIANLFKRKDGTGE